MTRAVAGILTAGSLVCFTACGPATMNGAQTATGGKQYIFSSDGTSGRLYKIDLTTGKVVGWAQTSLGRGEDDAGRLVHEIGCKDPNVVYLGSAILWNVTKVTITP